MIKMRDDHDDSSLGLQLEQDAQQCDGVSSAGDGDTNAITRLEQLAFANVLKDLFAHRKMV